MNQYLAALLLIGVMTLPTGCVITEAVTPPPPRLTDMPANAAQLLAQPLPHCADPGQVHSPVDRQVDVIIQQKVIVQSLIDSENARWSLRHSYLDRELQFYQRQVGNAPALFPLTAGPLKVSSDAWSEGLRQQREHEYNQHQYQRFQNEIASAQNRHEQRIQLYQERLNQLDNAVNSCVELKVALHKAQEEQELRKATQPLPEIAPQLETQPLPETPAGVTTPPTPPATPESVMPATIQVMQDANPEPAQLLRTPANVPVASTPVTPTAQPAFHEAENMEELLRQTAAATPAATNKTTPATTSTLSAPAKQPAEITQTTPAAGAPAAPQDNRPALPASTAQPVPAAVNPAQPLSNNAQTQQDWQLHGDTVVQRLASLETR